jgi:sugar/nucleoside kinase (ribokinase family)
MTQAAWDVVGLGENSVDVVYRLPGPVAANAKIAISSRRVLPGGQVATTLATCAALGLRSRYVGTFGRDEHGRLVRAALEARGIDTAGALVREAPTRHALILVDERTGERTVLWQRDAGLALRPEDVPRDLVTGARLLHVDNVDEEAAIAAARLARDAGMAVTCDIDRVTDRTRALIAAVTLPILAEHVPAALTGEPGLEQALTQWRQRREGPLCVTLGARGAVLLDGTGIHRAPAYPVDPIDTTGAGDVFRGALIYALLHGQAPGRMLQFANAAAAISCTREGAMGGVPTLAEVEALAARVD